MTNQYLTVLAGNPRGGEKTWETLRENVLKPLNSDLAICTGDKWLNDQSFIKYADYQWVFHEPEDWFSYYIENFKGTWRQYFELGKDSGLYNSGSIHFAIKDIILNNYLNELQKYDYIIYTRFDQFYLEEHPDFFENKIWIPTGEDYFGICDRHAVIPVEFIESFLGICTYIDNPESLKNNSNYLNCEVAFKNHLESIGLLKKVQRYDRKQFTSALSSDKTNWRIPKYKLYFFNDLMIKYPDEFIDSFNNIFKVKVISYLVRYPILSLNYIYLLIRRTIGDLQKRISFK